MFCRRNQWAAAKYPRELFYHSKSKAGGVLMHSKVRIVVMVIFLPAMTHICGKMIIASFRDRPFFGSSTRSNADSDSDTEDEDEEDEIVDDAVGWAYVGSHNFTPSAWGTLSGSAFNPSMNVSLPPTRGLFCS
jgi:tyrosyl-DNA phosphodiesterase-1